jgi:hypothetical protein
MIGKQNKYLSVPADDDVEDRLDQIADDDAVSKSAIVDAEHLSPRTGAVNSAVDSSANAAGNTGATAPAATPAPPPAAAGTPYPAIGFWIFMSCSVVRAHTCSVAMLPALDRSSFWKLSARVMDDLPFNPVFRAVLPRPLSADPLQ